MDWEIDFTVHALAQFSRFATQDYADAHNIIRLIALHDVPSGIDIEIDVRGPTSSRYHYCGTWGGIPQFLRDMTKSFASGHIA